MAKTIKFVAFIEPATQKMFKDLMQERSVTVAGDLLTQIIKEAKNGIKPFNTLGGAAAPVSKVRPWKEWSDAEQKRYWEWVKRGDRLPTFVKYDGKVWIKAMIPALPSDPDPHFAIYSTPVADGFGGLELEEDLNDALISVATTYIDADCNYAPAIQKWKSVSAKLQQALWQGEAEGITEAEALEWK